MEIPVGTSHTVNVAVDETLTADAWGSGLVKVYATPAMVALMEQAAARCVQTYLDDGMVTVGTALSIEHTGATPPGMQVWASATVTAVDGRRIEFALSARDECGDIGSGTHTRVCVDRERFLQKANAKGA